MRLFIIGNGFDLGHEMNTAYVDFETYLEHNHYSFWEQITSPYRLAHTIPLNGDIESSLHKIFWRNFESNLSKLNNEYFLEQAKSQTLNLEGGDIHIEDTLNAYHEEYFGHITELEKYLKQWIKSVEISNIRKTTLISKDNNDLYFTFNYTSTLNKLYEIDESRVFHIHGHVAKDDELMVGHGEEFVSKELKEKAWEARECFKEKESSIYNALATYYERSKKDVKRNIRQNQGIFSNRLGEINEVYIIGHSLGEVDLPYFYEINNKLKDTTRWKVFYYDEEESHSLRTKIEKNLGKNSDRYELLPTQEFYNQ